MIKEVFLNDQLSAYSEELDSVEDYFFRSITKIIIRYPIMWYNFVCNILKNNIILVCEYNSLIISYDLLTPKLKSIWNFIHMIMNKTKVITKVVTNNNFLIYYLYSKNIANFFRYTDHWLQYLTKYTLEDITGTEIHRGCYIHTADCQLTTLDILFGLDDFYYIIECRDNKLYTEDDLLTLSNYKKNLIPQASLAFVTQTKNDLLPESFKKLKIYFIEYKYDYYEFVDELQKFIVIPIIKKML